LIVGYWDHVKAFYVKAGEPTSEQNTIRQGLGFVHRLYGSIPAAEFDTLALKAVWEYRPPRSKSQHHNDDPDLDYVVYLGPKAQRVIRRFLTENPEDDLFSPKRAEESRNARRKAERKSPMTPSQAARRPRGRKRAPIREHYTVASFRQAIRRACVKAGIPPWQPHQLRHAAGTAIRKRFGLEASQAVLGHKELSATQVYAEKSRAAAKDTMKKVG
jgi:hypothetical protein